MGIEILDTERNKALQALTEYPYFVLNMVNPEGTKNMLRFKEELIDIKRNYVIYKQGAGFTPEGAKGDYVPSQLKFKTSKNLIDKEARFMFSQTPDIKVISQDIDVDEMLKQYQSLIDKVIENNNLSKTLLQAAKDCFVGKRVACLIELSETEGILVRFYTSLQFYVEREPGTEKITRFICFEKINEHTEKTGRLYLIKDYILSDDRVNVKTAIFDGTGKELETLISTQIELDEIPVVIITNDGTLEDKHGVSEIEDLEDFESAYNRLGNVDIDSLRKGANPVYVLVDMNPRTTKGLSLAPGSIWDIHGTQDNDNPHPDAKILAPPMTHSEPTKTTLQRIRQAAHAAVDVPDISEEGLLSGITSFKALKALYYPLMVRCDEKMKTWIPALKKVFKTVITFALLEPELINGIYAIALGGEKPYDILIEQNYALLEDENEEKEIDLQEVQTKTMSVSSYLKKWRSDDLRTEQQRDEEIMRIATEASMFDSASLNMNVNNELTKQFTDDKIEEDIQNIETQQKAKTQTKESIVTEE